MLKMRMTVLSWHSPGIASHPHHIAFILQIWKQHLKQCFEKYRQELWRECFFDHDTTTWTPAWNMISDSLNVLQVLQVRRKSFVYLATPKTLLKTTSQAHRSSPPRPEERWAVHMWIHPAQGQLHVWLACWPEFLAWPETPPQNGFLGSRTFLWTLAYVCRFSRILTQRNPFRKAWRLTCPSTVYSASGLPHGYKKWNLGHKVSPNCFFNLEPNKLVLALSRVEKKEKPIYIWYNMSMCIWHAIPLHAMPCHAISYHARNTEDSIYTRHNTQSMHNIHKMYIQYTHCSHKYILQITYTTNLTCMTYKTYITYTTYATNRAHRTCPKCLHACIAWTTYIAYYNSSHTHLATCMTRITCVTCIQYTTFTKFKKRTLHAIHYIHYIHCLHILAYLFLQTYLSYEIRWHTAHALHSLHDFHIACRCITLRQVTSHHITSQSKNTMQQKVKKNTTQNCSNYTTTLDCSIYSIHVYTLLYTTLQTITKLRDKTRHDTTIYNATQSHTTQRNPTQYTTKSKT